MICSKAAISRNVMVRSMIPFVTYLQAKKTKHDLVLHTVIHRKKKDS